MFSKRIFSQRKLDFAVAEIFALDTSLTIQTLFSNLLPNRMRRYSFVSDSSCSEDSSEYSSSSSDSSDDECCCGDAPSVAVRNLNDPDIEDAADLVITFNPREHGRKKFRVCDNIRGRTVLIPKHNVFHRQTAGYVNRNRPLIAYRSWNDEDINECADLVIVKKRFRFRGEMLTEYDLHVNFRTDRSVIPIRRLVR